MEPSAVESLLADQAANVHADLHDRWGDVPHSSRTVDAEEYDYPGSPDDLFPHVAVSFVVDGLSRSGTRTAETRVLVCRDEKHNDLVWEPSGGKGCPGEKPAETAEREIREETGIVAEIQTLIATELLRFDHGHAVMPVLQAVFIAERTGGQLNPEPGIEPRWFPVDELPGETQYREQSTAAARNFAPVEEP